MEHLNPRYARTVALGKPSDREQNQWYFQRYVKYLPTAGEMSSSTAAGTTAPVSNG
jgi:polyphosphate kinase 2 (PPK2 family)